MKHRPGKLLHCLLAMALAGSSLTVQALQPLVSDDTGTQGLGKHQLESTFSRSRVSGEPRRNSEIAAVYAYGLKSDMDIFFGVSHAHIQKFRGWGNPLVGVKWRVLESSDQLTSLAITPELRLPVSLRSEAEGLGTGKPSGYLNVVISHALPEASFHLNLGWGRDRYISSAIAPHEKSQRASLASVFELGPQWRLALEAGQERKRAAQDSISTRFVGGGLILSLKDDLEVSMGLHRILSGPEKASTSTIGLAMRY
jgi:hypothetical protein